MNLLGGASRHFRLRQAALTRFTHGNDSAAPLSDRRTRNRRDRQVIHPAGAPDTIC